MRGTGTTSQQMLAAPKNAVYVWPHSDFSYPKELARKLGRDDLKIVGPGWVNNNLRGRRDVEVIIDHATELEPEQLTLWHYFDTLSKTARKL